MTNTITLTASMRSNLSSLKSLASQMSTTQTRLSTGKKVNSAIDNANSYYQARALTNRAGDLDSLLDSMGQSIQTITAASEAIDSGLSLIEQMKSVAQSAIGNIDNLPHIIQPGEPMTIGGLHNGRAYTQAIVDQLGEKGLAAYACNQFYAPGVSADDENFGQGKWYLPSIGELMDMYGYDGEAAVQAAIEAGDFSSKTGAIGDNKAAINEALATLHSKGADATALTDDRYWASSEHNKSNSWSLNMSIAYRSSATKTAPVCVRAFQLLENCFTPLEGGAAPQIGDVMYSDLTYGKASEYDGSKTAVGVVTWVSDDGASARIMSLKDLTFSSSNQVGNFDPANPYGGAQNKTIWCTSDKYSEDITDIPNIRNADKSLNLEVMEWNPGSGGGTDIVDFSAYTEQFNAIYSQYDAMVKDASYQGINLLDGGNLTVMFNETRTHSHQVEGYRADAAALGINTAAWSEAADIEATITQLQNATSQLRNIAGDLGNHLSIIETRQDFTDNLIDVLETGADNLVLADMNEESANYLALQTRQQLAVNSLSLASQSAQSVLSLF